MKLRPLFVVYLLLFIAIATPAKSKPWKEVRSPHFRVFTNGSLRDARQVAYEFEQLRNVFAAQYPKIHLDSGAPLLIFAARDEGTAKSLQPALKKMKNGNLVAGEYFSDWEKQFVMARLDAWREGTKDEIYHEYAHSILNLNFMWLPDWLDEGLAEFYGSTEFNGHTVSMGEPTLFLRYMGGITGVFTPIPIETLMDAPSPFFEGGNRAPMFYAESWAFVDYMMFGKGMERGKRFAQFLDLVQKGIDQKKAFRRVFGGFKQMDKILNGYMHRRVFPIYELKVAPDIDKKAFAARTLTMAETDAQLAGFHLWSGDLDGAQSLAKQALKENPKLGLAHEEIGYLLFSQGKRAEAEKEFSRAYALDGKLYLSLFAKTMLSSQATSSAPANESQFAQALKKVVQINPQFAPAYVQLAILSVRQNNLRAALGYSRHAELLQPSRAGYHLLTGHILLRAGNGANAAQFAKFVADRWSGSDHDEAVELWNRIPASQRPAGVVLSPDEPQNTKMISGAIKSVACGPKTSGPVYTIVRDGASLTFRESKSPYAAGFSDTIWYGQDHFNFCHNLDGMRAVLYYRPSSDSHYAGDYVNVEIRNDLPPAPASPKQPASVKPGTVPHAATASSKQGSAATANP